MLKTNLNKYTFENILNAVISAAKNTNASVAVWSLPGLDLSKIAIKDPYSDPLQKTDSRELPRQIPPQKLQRIEPESNTDWNANRREKTESLVIEPPPLVGSFDDEKDSNTVSDSTPEPSVPKLLTQKSTPSTSPASPASPASPMERDPNAPPPPIPEERITQNTRKMPSLLQNKIASAGQTGQRSDGRQFVGDLVVVKRKELSNVKPIGFVKHVWKHGDSLPDLAELYLNDKNRYLEIVAINGEDISNPTKIPIGTVLKIPVY